MSIPWLKKILVFYLLLFCILEFSLLSQGIDKSQIFIYGDFGIPDTLDPITANIESEHHLCQFVFDSLLVENDKGEFIFSLAKNLDISPDGLSYTFILRKNLKWSDGTALTTYDIQFTLKLMLNSKTYNYNSTLLKYIEDVICITPKIVTITLARPFYSPLSLFTFKILPKHKFEKQFLKFGDKFSKHPIGCGPFKYYRNKARIFLLRSNPFFQYRKGPFLKGVVCKIYSNKSQAVRDLINGKLHLVTEVLPKDIPIIEKYEKRFVLKKYQNRTIHFVAFNHHRDYRYHELFKDYRFRRALLYSINREKILQDIFLAGSNKKNHKGQAHSLISGPFPINSWAYNEKIKPFNYNLSYAKELLKEILTRKNYIQNKGFWQNNKGEPIRFTFKYPAGDDSIKESCKIIANSFRKLGLQVDLEEKTSKELEVEVLKEHKFDIVYRKYNFDNTIDIFPLFDPQQTGKGQSNFSGYVNTKLVEIFYKMHNCLNPWILRSLAYKIHKIVNEETVHLFLWQLDIYAAHQQKLKSFKLHSCHLFNFPEKWKIISD